MKKKLSLILAIMMIAVSLLSLASCSAKSDLEYIKSRGKIIIGITDYAPYDYEESAGDGKWIGFDADMAKALGEKLGVDVEFMEIDWDSKITELKSKKIDLIWNGMTVTDELAAEMDFSYPYAQNSQVVVIKADNASAYTSLDSLKGKKVTAESGSAGEKAAVEAFGEADVVAISSQVKALFEVSAGTAEAAIIDYSMAKSLCGSGDYAGLVMIEDIRIGQEEFAVGIRKDSDLTAQVNALLVSAYKDGTMKALQEKYGKQEDGSNAIALCDLSGK